MELKIKFKVPDIKIRQYALGQYQQSELQLQTFLNNLQQQQKVIKTPKKGDWLDCNPHEGQTFNVYKSRVKMGEGNYLTQARNVIYFQLLDQDIPEDFLKELQIYCSAFFQTQVEILQKQLDLKRMKDVKSRLNDNMIQYCAPDIFNQIDKLLPKNGFCIIGLTMKDIFIDEDNSYVFGLADPRSRKGVFSFNRYINTDSNEDSFGREMLFSACKIVCHEISHLFGLRHCIYYQCIMNGSNHLQEDLSKPITMCPVCLRKLYHGCCEQINLQKRMGDLMQACLNFNFQNEIEYYKQILSNQ